MSPSYPPNPDTLLDAARDWIADDPDPRTAAELEALVIAATCADPRAAAGARAEIADRFAGPLAFGTAGLRGAMAAGPNRMNRVVVLRAAAGLVGYLRDCLAQQAPDQPSDELSELPRSGAGEDAPAERPPRIVIGYDARHNSHQFALDTAAVAVAAGCETLILPSALPTPVLAFAVRHLEADAGVMVTASHNPAQDNGYKVYLGARLSPPEGRGVQIVPPADAEIAARIAAAPPIPSLPRASQGWQVLGPQVLADYIASAAALVAGAPGDEGAPRELSIVLTPLHGVGAATALSVLAAAGFSAPYVVPEQGEPDPDFPTVAFPNPEEPGALDLALAAALARGADLVLANDPDADRCAIAVPVAGPVAGPVAVPVAVPVGGPVGVSEVVPGAEPAGRARTGQVSWRVLTGDELGCLLAEHLLSRERRLPGGELGAPARPLACSVVSSQMLQLIAQAHDATFSSTLTGFKWIARTPELFYGYEEALGYCVAPDLVRDKDGITAALLICELAARTKAAGRSMLDLLDDLETRHGVHATAQLSVRVADLSEIGAAMGRLRKNPPEMLGGFPVSSVEDLLDPSTGLPPTDGLRLRTRGRVRIVVRPSGTEPKLKCYLEAVTPVRDRTELGAARSVARQRLEAALADLRVLVGGAGA